MADENDNLTPAERAEVSAASAESAAAEAAKTVDVTATAAGNAAADAADDAARAAAAAAAAAKEDKPDPATRALERIAERVETALDRVASANAPAKEETVVKARDFDAERAALRAQRDAGEIDEAEYETRAETILEAKLEAKVLARSEEFTQRQSAEQQQQRWDTDFGRFSADAANKAILDDPDRRAVFQQRLNAAAKTDPTAGNVAWLEAARAATAKAFGIKIDAVVDPSKKIDEATREREKKAGDRPGASLDNAPAGGGNAADTPDWMTRLDALPIDDLENALARLPKDKADEYLSRAPGGLQDNPKAVA